VPARVEPVTEGQRLGLGHTLLHHEGGNRVGPAST
jgi:hypothetical protein